MTDKITEPVTPEVTAPAPLGPLSGDWHDDDAQAYEDDFQINPGGPVDPEGVPHSKPSITPTTRILQRSLVIGNDGAGNYAPPIMLFPADPNRKSLTLLAYGETQMYFSFGSDLSDCYNGNLYPVYPSTIARSWPTLQLDGHTGAVWVYADSGNDPITVVGVAVSV